jgi:carbamoyltransferase
MNESASILGIGGSIHDFSSCILRNGKVLNYIEDERLVRKKHAFYPGAMYELTRSNASDDCLRNAGLTLDDIDLVVANDILAKFYYRKIKPKAKQFHMMSHHLSHACSAFYPSRFEEAVILTIDGGGTNVTQDGENSSAFSNSLSLLEVCSIGVGSGRQLDIVDIHIGQRYPTQPYDNKIDPVADSIGGFYGILTHTCGFTFHEEGKTMGLAPYGTNRYVKEMSDLVQLKEKGRFVFPQSSIRKLLEMRKLWEEEKDQDRSFQIRADLAWAGQHITELAYIHAAEYAKKLTGLECLCLAGGVALNSVANYKIYKTGLFKDVFIQPAAGDNGTSIGAAYYGWHVILGQPRALPLESRSL